MLKKRLLALKFNFNIRVIALFLIIIQSCSLDFLEKKGTILIVVVLLLSIQGFKNFVLKDGLRLLGILAFLLLLKVVNPSFEFSSLIFESGLIFEVYVLLLCYRNYDLAQIGDDFYSALSVFFVNALLGYFFYLIIPFAFVDYITAGYPYKTFIYLFFVTNADGIRNTGFLWEPGLLQLMLNLFLFYAINKRKPAWLLLLIVLTLIPTFSTSGYFCLALNYLYFIFYNFKEHKRKVFALLIITLVSSSALVFMLSNITDKLGGENLSGLARLRDLYIGEELIREKPLLGHGIYDENYLKSRPYVAAIEDDVFGAKTAGIMGSLAGGYVNGFLDIFEWFGVPAGLFVYYCLYRNRFIGQRFLERIIFMMILCFTFFAEPITYTSFFLLFPISTIVYPYTKKSKSLPEKPDDFNSNSDL